jgi:hypothetical protein
VAVGHHDVELDQALDQPPGQASANQRLAEGVGRDIDGADLVAGGYRQSLGHLIPGQGLRPSQRVRLALVAQRRQRPRRRITPNTNTSTTTMISTHNHVDMTASLVGAGAIQTDATAAHLGKQLGHGQATSRAWIDGRAARRLAETLHPRPAPPIWAGPGGGARPAADHASAPVGLSPSGHAQPVQLQPYRSAPQEEEDPVGVNRPNRTTASPTVGYGEAERSLPCLGGGTIQAW